MTATLFWKMRIFESAAPKKSQIIDIEAFVKEEEINTSFYEAPYFLAPSKGGEKAYQLLRKALEDSGKLAIGSYVMRSKEHVCALKPNETGIVLMRLRFAEELRDMKDLDIPTDATIKPAELKMAKALIDQLTPDDFSIEQYKDTYNAELLKVIEKKAKGKASKEPKFKLVYSKSKDLMAQLKASLEADAEKKPASKKAS